MSIEAGMPNYSGCHAHWTPITYSSVAAGVWILTDTKPTTGASSDRDGRPLNPGVRGEQGQSRTRPRRKPVYNFLRGCRQCTVYYCKVASRCSAAIRSAVSKPSTNCSNIGDRSARALSGCPCAAHSAAKSTAVRSSHDRAACRRLQSSDWIKHICAS